MKHLYPFVLLLAVSPCLHAQNYIPLLLDSSYHRYQYYDFIFTLDTVVTENIQAFTYDANDSLIQRRLPASRQNFSYAPDTVFLIMEKPDTNNTWQNNRRITTASEDSKIISTFQETYTNGNWENSSLETHSYDASQHDTLQLILLWDNGTWRNHSKKAKTYNAAGDNTEERTYYAGSDGNFKFNQGHLYEYDNQHHLIQDISINNGSNGPYYTSKRNWVYGADNLLDTTCLCHYHDGICDENVLMNTYAYLSPDTLIWKHFGWNDDDNAWEVSTTTLQST